jgi:hypothetical protein
LPDGEFIRKCQRVDGHGGLGRSDPVRNEHANAYGVNDHKVGIYAYTRFGGRRLDSLLSNISKNEENSYESFRNWFDC